MAEEGWTWLWNAKKEHYFVDGRSLCGRWGLVGPGDLHRSKDDSPNNCRECVRRLAQQRLQTKEAQDG